MDATINTPFDPKMVSEADLPTLSDGKLMLLACQCFEQALEDGYEPDMNVWLWRDSHSAEGFVSMAGAVMLALGNRPSNFDFEPESDFTKSVAEAYQRISDLRDDAVTWDPKIDVNWRPWTDFKDNMRRFRAYAEYLDGGAR